jgi:hypothetical protein
LTERFYGRLKHTALLEGDKAVVADDDVVEEFDAEQRAALMQALRDAAVLGTTSMIIERECICILTIVQCSFDQSYC